MKLQSKDIGKNIGKRDILEKLYKFYLIPLHPGLYLHSALQ